ncbi:hypothetical protein [Haloarchaeobius amylolyticus]|nr:hypothetical protein [Haloarchaeobius amylolyticus]
MFELLTRLVTGPSSEEIVECRNCGTPIEHEGVPCPACDGTNFARYELAA